jgi:hypothetical protein
MTKHDEQSAVMAGVVRGIWDEYDALKCEIQADDSGWYVLNNSTVVADGLTTCGDAVEEAEAQGLIVMNTDDVERWMQPPADWGIVEEPTP